MFIRVLSLSKFRCWLRDSFSSNKLQAQFSHSTLRQKQSYTQSFQLRKAKPQKSFKSQRRVGEAGEGPCLFQTIQADLDRGGLLHKLDYSVWYQLLTSQHFFSAFYLPDLDNDRGSRRGNQILSKD